MADSEKYFTKLVDGQLSVATVAQSGEIIPEESRPGEKYTTALVQTDDGPQLCVKTYDLNGGGGGGGGTVDQTYDPTSTNAQSGTAVAEAVAPALKNTATGTNSLTILGTASTYPYQVNIGVNSVGGQNTVSIGQGANAHVNENCVLIGQMADSSRDGGIAIGRCAKVTAFNAIQLGTINGAVTTNSTANSFQVFNYQMLDANGHIPNERIYYPQPLYKAYTIVGNEVTVDSNNIASGFKSYGNDNANNSYLLINKKFPASYTLFEIDIEFTCGNFNLDKGYPLIVGNNTITDWYVAGNPSDNTAYYLARWDGWDNVAGSTHLSQGNTYSAKLIRNFSNNKESCYLLVNNEWVEQWNVTIDAHNWPADKYFGIGASYKYEQGFDNGGTINLNKTAIYFDGVCFFNGAKDWIPSTAAITGVPGYDSTKTQVLKNVNGVLTWVDE